MASLKVRLFETRLVKGDRTTVIVANSEIYNGHIENLNALGMRRICIDVFVAASVSVSGLVSGLVRGRGLVSDVWRAVVLSHVAHLHRRLRRCLCLG